MGDRPIVEGITGLRPWHEHPSVLCHKSRGLAALADLIAATDARRIFLSYSDDGHVALDDLLPQLAELGRYRPNQQAADTRASVHEFLVELEGAEAVDVLGARSRKARVHRHRRLIDTK